MGEPLTMLQAVLDDQWADDNWVRRVGDHRAALGKVQPGQGRVLEPKSALEETCTSHGACLQSTPTIVSSLVGVGSRPNAVTNQGDSFWRLRITLPMARVLNSHQQDHHILPSVAMAGKALPRVPGRQWIAMGTEAWGSTQLTT